MSMKDKYGLTTSSVGYKPFRYPWAYDMWKAQQRVHWLPEEITTLGDDVKDWRQLPDHERNLITQIFRLFTQSDIDVNDNYMERYAQVFRPTEVKMMLSAFSNMETIHIDAYSLLVETVGMAESEYQAFMGYKAMKEKHAYLGTFTVDNERQVLKTMAAFGAFTEGLQLFASFAMLLNFPRFGKMKGMGQVVTWSVRDESLHCEGIIQLFHELAAETGAYDDSLKQELIDIARTSVELEDKFIDLAFELGPVQGMTAEEVKAYIRFVADWRLEQLKAVPEGTRVFGSDPDVHPLPWLPALLNGVEHANFFETRATEYSKGATSGSWSDTWEHFDRVLQG